MSEPQEFTIETDKVDRILEFLVNEFEDPLHAALACLSAYVVLCENHSQAPSREAMARHAVQVIMSMEHRAVPDEMRPN